MLDTLTRRLSDYLIYVVEDYTSVDQRAVHRHSRALQARRTPHVALGRSRAFACSPACPARSPLCTQPAARCRRGVISR